MGEMDEPAPEVKKAKGQVDEKEKEKHPKRENQENNDAKADAAEGGRSDE